MTPAEILLAAAALITAYAALRKAYSSDADRTSGEWRGVVKELKEHIERVERLVDSLETKIIERDGRIEDLQQLSASLRKDVTRLTRELNELRRTRKEEIDELEYLLSVAIDHMDVLSNEIEKLQGTPPRKPQEIINWLKKYKDKRNGGQG